MASSNPRRSSRTPVTRAAETNNALTPLKTNMTLRKSSTFHSPTSSTSSHDDFEAPSIRRSDTNLDDVIGAHVRRAAMMIDNVDKSLNINTSSRKTRSSMRDNSMPVPRGLLGPPIVDPAMAKEAERRVLRPRNRRSSKQQASDSGLGTSVASTKENVAPTSGKNIKASAITRSAATSSSAMEKVPALNSRATNRIREHIMRPLLAKPSLKDFEPIVLDIPRRIRSKEIICLRDLEKTLIFMAPERTKTADLYLDFCLTAIRCIQSNWKSFTDRERTRPRDRLYTDLYFMDLEEQIREYATQLAAAKETGNVMDVDIKDEVRLHGGLSENGRQAQLVRVNKDGKAFYIATGEPVDLDEDTKSPTQVKRSMSEQLEDEEEIMRSMARRKKNPTPEELAPKKCRAPGCNKEFKRPCDLTKHEKTHSRPWKCPVTSCKYHTYGWPTEKEMDRHHNDKHSSAPPMYKCLYENCPYKSKRESNCKQHMEKAHGWQYVRTKTNGKKGGSPQENSTAQATPLLQHVSTPSSSYGVATPPEEHISDFPYNPHNLDYPAYLPTNDQLANYANMPLHIDGIDGLEGLDGLDMSPLDDTTSSVSSYDNFSGYREGSGPNFTLDDEELYAAPAHLPTPDPAAFNKMLAQPSFQPYPISTACQNEPVPAHISPIGQGNRMLYTPNSLADVDEGFEDFPGAGMGNDFQLYPSTSKAASYDSLFADVPSTGLGFSQTSQDIFPTTMDWASQDFHTYNQH